MGEQARAIARAVKRPMRRWWLRTGSWWAGAILLLYGAAYFLQWVTLQQWLQFGIFNQPLNILAAVCSSLAALLATLCWVQAALRCNASISSVMVDFAHPSEAEVRRARLWLCFASAVPLFALVAVLHTLLRLPGIELQGLLNAAGQYRMMPVNWTWYFATAVHESMRTLWAVPYCLLWCCALLAARPERPPLAWPWTLPAIVPQALEFLMVVDLQRAASRGTMGLINSMGRLPYHHLPALWPIGYFLLLLLIWSLQRDRRRLWLPLYVVLVISVVAYIPNWHSVAINTNPPPDHPVVLLVNACGALSALALTEPLEFYPRDRRQWDHAAAPVPDQQPGKGTLRIRSVYHGFVRDLPNWWALVAFAGNLAWLMAQFFILAAILGWPGRRPVPRERAQSTEQC